VKNKVAAPFRQAEFDIEYGVGISKQGSLIDLGLENDIVQKSGSFFSYGELRLGQGRNNAKQFLAENPEVAAEIESKVLTAVGVERDPAPAPIAAAEDPAEEPPAEEAPKAEKKAA
jgi:recombination protein RecA